MDTITIKRGATAEIPFTAPEGASLGTLIVVAGGVRQRHPITPDDTGKWMATISAEDTALLIAGKALAEAYWTADAKVSIDNDLQVEVLDTLSANDGIREREPTDMERTLAAARKALLQAADNSTTSFTVGETSYTFESRGELLSFVNRLAAKVDPVEAF